MKAIGGCQPFIERYLDMRNVSLCVQLMTIENYAQIYELWHALPGIGLSDADSEESIARYLERNPNLSFVYFQDNKLVGSNPFVDTMAGAAISIMFVCRLNTVAEA